MIALTWAPHTASFDEPTRPKGVYRKIMKPRLSLDYRDQIFSTREIATANERLAAARQLYAPHSLQAAFGYSNRGSHDGSKNVRPTYSIL